MHKHCTTTVIVKFYRWIAPYAIVVHAVQGLHVTAREPDKPVDAKAVNFRAMPDDWDPMEVLRQLEERIALGFGVQPRRVAPEQSRERFGNAQQASMMQSDEPGMRALKHSIVQFITSVLLGGLPLHAEFMSKNSVENYARVMKDQAVAQTISQLGTALNAQQQMDYLVRMGLLEPQEAGLAAIRTSESQTKSLVSPNGHWISLRWPDGTPLVFDPPVAIDSRLSYKQSQLPLLRSAAKAVSPTFDTEGCAMEAVGRYEEWIRDDLPHLVREHGFSYQALSDDINDLAVLLWAAMLACARAQIGDIRHPFELQNELDLIRSGWYNAIGSPTLARPDTIRPQHNLFQALWSFQARLATGDATLADLQQAAAAFTAYIPRYFNQLRAVWNLRRAADAMDQTPDLPVEWVRSASESCGDCLRLEGHYKNMDDLIKASGGRLPGDPRLGCKGNCKCSLVIGKQEYTGEQIEDQELPNG